MLRYRVLTAAVLLPPLLLALIYLPTPWLALLFGVFIAAGAWEWTALIGLRDTVKRALYTVALLVLGALLLFSTQQTAALIFTVALVGWVLALVALVREQDWFASAAVRYLGGALLLLPPWVAAAYLHAADPRHPQVLLFALVVVWVADSMAYFAGHFFGRHKLAPTISPGKTVEGVIGGVLGVALLAGISGTLMWQYRGAQLALWVALAIVAASFSVLGDLLESKFKRIAGVKDSGSLLPGHGGVLDRIDALTAALPIFALGWYWLFRTL